MLIALVLSAQFAVFGLASPSVVPPVDTPPPSARPRVSAIEVSEWYHRRFVLHQWLSYSSIPAFGFQYAAGRQIWKHGSSAPGWARDGHRIGAAALAVVFTVNTITGAWNLWDSRAVEEGRRLRYAHAISMLIADAGFTWAGARLSEQAETNAAKRRLHAQVALSSMAIAAASGIMMKVLNK